MFGTVCVTAAIPDSGSHTKLPSGSGVSTPGTWAVSLNSLDCLLSFSTLPSSFKAGYAFAFIAGVGGASGCTRFIRVAKALHTSLPTHTDSHGNLSIYGAESTVPASPVGSQAAPLKGEYCIYSVIC